MERTTIRCSVTHDELTAEIAAARALAMEYEARGSRLAEKAKAYAAKAAYMRGRLIALETQRATGMPLVRLGQGDYTTHIYG